MEMSAVPSSGEVTGQARKNARARKDAQILLDWRGKPRAHRDQWRIDRARWLYQYGNRSAALEELKDVNDFRDALRWDGTSTEPALPKSVLHERVGTPLPEATS